VAGRLATGPRRAVTTGPRVERREEPVEDVPVDLVEAAARVREARESGGGEERDGGAAPTAEDARWRSRARPRRARDGEATLGHGARDGKEPTGGGAPGKRNWRSARESKVNPRTSALVPC
jgi:hypothetical protein